MSEPLTYHNAPRYLLARILEAKRPATREELEVLFVRHCIGHAMEPRVLAYFKANELQRLVVLELYRANVIVKAMDRGCVMQQLADGLGVHRKTVETWVKYFEHEQTPN